jgi:RHH-type transcriptional regulator, proline utilization regulon repressor / proline dehydrogenase / delta 1-pyrroline-5-carboxylate dehydrogenase
VDPGWRDTDEVEAAVAVAESLLAWSEDLITRGERRRRARLARLLESDAGRQLLFVLTDEVLRYGDASRATRRLRALVAGSELSAVGPLDRAALILGAAASPMAPGLVRRAVRIRFDRELRGVVSVGERATRAALRGAAGEDFRVNANLLGEAILGDGEAERRLAAVCGLLQRPDITCVSVKVTALCANLDPLAFDFSVGRIAERLTQVYRAAQLTQPPKFVYLDMEDFEDLHLTVSAFKHVLAEPEFMHLPAGIALQAYLPDSHEVLDDICRFAHARAGAGGSPLRVRLVKGANLSMETVRAELAGWTNAVYPTKPEVDASFKHMLDTAIDAGAPADLRVGVGSHNLFDIAWALVHRERRHAADRVSIEMLNGMAPAMARAVKEVAGDLLLYAPVVMEEDFASSIAYLSRRLDENTGPENFLRSMFSISLGAPSWVEECQRFRHAVADRSSVSVSPRRRQDRRREHLSYSSEDAFTNEPDTDFSLEPNRGWALECLASTRPATLPPLIVDRAGIDELVGRAAVAGARWAEVPPDQRRSILARAAGEMAADRGHTLAVMALETAKTLREGDPEISEAIDMARWSIHCSRVLDELTVEGVRCDPVGLVLVAGPWNFPYAIPANGVCSALAAGNAVLFKPAPEAVGTGVELVRQLHRAGVPPDVLQLVRCPDDEVGQHLICHDGVKTVVLTGAYETAEMFERWKPSLRLLAETSGKNALVITSSADLDLAIADLVRSAFGHAGQKCSAASLAIIDAGLYDGGRFFQRLADAVTSLRVGPVTDVATMVGPLVQPPREALRRALTVLDPGESWLVEPRQLDAEGRLWRPGVKVGVRPGSWFHRTECFGPVLGVMRARDVAHALELQNAVPYGLTGGVHTLDPAEIDTWLAGVQVGNAYINRHITGAIVRRQPFGGWKRSSVGPTAKAGGPDYLLRFVRPQPQGELPGVESAKASYQHWWESLYATGHDESNLRSESNMLRHFPLDKVVVRAGQWTTSHEIDLLRLAAARTGTAIEVSAEPASSVGGDRLETESELAARIGESGVVRLRHLAPIGDELRSACHRGNITVDDTPVTGHGRIELPCWLRAQAVSRTLHRHGRVTPVAR